MNYTVKAHLNPQDLSAPAKYYASPSYGRTLTLDDLTAEISHATSITPADVKAVVQELFEVFSRYLVRGEKIKIDGIGTFRVIFTSKGRVLEEDVSAADIDRTTIRVAFVADSALKKRIKIEIAFDKVRSSNGTTKEDKESVEEKEEMA